MIKKLFGTAAAAVMIATGANAQQLPDPIPNPPNADESAVIYRIDNICQGSLNGQPVFGDIFFVQSNAQGATRPSILVCKGETDIELDRVSIRTGYQCFTPFGVTTDSRQVVTPSGKWTSTCKFRD